MYELIGLAGDVLTGELDTWSTEWVVTEERLPCFLWLYPTLFEYELLLKVIRAEQLKPFVSDETCWCTSRRRR